MNESVGFASPGVKKKCSNNHHTKFNDCKICITVNFNLYVLSGHDMIVLLRLIIILFAVHAIMQK